MPTKPSANKITVSTGIESKMPATRKLDKRPLNIFSILSQPRAVNLIRKMIRLVQPFYFTLEF